MREWSGIASELLTSRKKLHKPICCNVDFYSGFVYSMLGIPKQLYTPIFAISRIAGWSAHRIEELVNEGKIIRPAYKYVGHHCRMWRWRIGNKNKTQEKKYQERLPEAPLLFQTRSGACR